MQGFTTGEKLAGAGAAAGTAYKFGKPILKTLGKIIRPLGFPSVAAGLAAGELMSEDPDLKVAGLDLLLPELIKKGAPRGSGIMSMIGRGLANPFGRAARVFTPVGATITAAGLAKDYYDFAKDEIKKVRAMSDEEREAYNEALMDEGGGLLD